MQSSLRMQHEDDCLIPSFLSPHSPATRGIRSNIWRPRAPRRSASVAAGAPGEGSDERPQGAPATDPEDAEALLIAADAQPAGSEPPGAAAASCPARASAIPSTQHSFGGSLGAPLDRSTLTVSLDQRALVAALRCNTLPRILDMEQQCVATHLTARDVVGRLLPACGDAFIDETLLKVRRGLAVLFRRHPAFASRL